MFEVAPVGALVEEEARGVARGEVEFEEESVFENVGLEGEAGVTLEEDGIGPVLIFSRENALKDSLGVDVKGWKDIGELIGEGLDSFGGGVMKDEVVAEEVHPT